MYAKYFMWYKQKFQQFFFSVQTLTCKGMWTGPAEKQFQPFEELIQNDQFVSDDYSTVEDDVYNNNEDQSSVVVTNVNYLVGILDEPYLSRINDKVRCFIYQETSNGGFRLAQSKDASCKGLVNVRKDGYRTMHLTPGTTFVYKQLIFVLQKNVNGISR